MVLLIIIPIKWLFHWEYTLFSDKPKWMKWMISIGALKMEPKTKKGFIVFFIGNRMITDWVCLGVGVPLLSDKKHIECVNFGWF